MVNIFFIIAMSRHKGIKKTILIRVSYLLYIQSSYYQIGAMDHNSIKMWPDSPGVMADMEFVTDARILSV